MISPAAVVKQFLPEVDERIWMAVAAIGMLAVLAMKDVTLPHSLMLIGAIAGLIVWWRVARQSPELLFYGLIAYIPFSHILSGRHAESGRLLTPTMALMGIVALAQWWQQRPRAMVRFHEMPRASQAVLIFLGLSMVSFLRTGWIYGSWYLVDRTPLFLQWILPVVGFFLTIWVVQDARVLKTALTLIMVAVVIVTLMALWEYLGRAGESFDQSRVRGIADHPNVLGAFFVSYMFLFLGWIAAFPRRWMSWAMLVPFLLCVRGIMVTFSRGAYLALAAGALVTCAIRQKKWLLAAAAIGVVVLLHPSFLPEGIRYRMGMTFVKGGGELSTRGTVTENLETSAAGRVMIWQAAGHMIEEHPWWGLGFGAFNGFLGEYTHGTLSDMNAHNSFLMIAAEQGVGVAIAFVAALGFLGLAAWHLSRRTQDATIAAMAIGFLGGLAGLIVANLFTVCIDAPEVVSYFWILAGLVVRGLWLERARHTT